MKSYTFEEFWAGRTFVSDARPFHDMLDGEFQFPDSFHLARSIWMFFLPEEGASHNDMVYHLAGYIWVRADGFTLDVHIENTEQEFTDLRKAAEYLWNNWSKIEYGRSKKWRTFHVRLDGEICPGNICIGDDELREFTRRNVPDGYGLDIEQVFYGFQIGDTPMINVPGGWIGATEICE